MELLVAVVVVVACTSVLYVDGVDVSVTTTIGQITGASKDITYNGSQVTATSFLGIPFAEPPIGARRFKKPEPKAAFQEPFVAKTMPPACPQNSVWYSTQAVPIPKDEDCLSLNIFIPGDSVDTTKSKAVMVWIFGGSFTMGWQSLLASPQFAGLNDVIYVTMNYRINVFGFLSHGDNTNSGNYGLWDQQLAIKWVHDHIASFGGDVNRVTIFGNSAGGAAVMFQTLYEGNNGLFQRAIAMSGSASANWALQTDPAQNFNNFAAAKNCTKFLVEDTLDCLRELTWQELVGVAGEVSMFTPTVDGEFYIMKANDIFKNETEVASTILNHYRKLDYMFGVVSEEGGLFAATLQNIVTSLGGKVSEGVSLDIMPQIIGLMLDSLKLPDNKVAENAVLQQYVDWSDPENLVKNRRGLLQFYTDILFNVPAIKSATQHAMQGPGSSYVYVFDHRPSYSTMAPWLLGANHADDDAFVLAFPAETMLRWYDVTDIEDPVDGVQRSEFDLAADVMRYWTNFAKSGNPNIGDDSTPSELTNWPEFTTYDQKYIVLNTTGLSGPFPMKRRLSAAGVAFRNNVLPAIRAHIDKCDQDRAVSSGHIMMPYGIVWLFVGTILLL